MISNTSVFITGANAGLGFETVKALLQSSKSYHIFLGTRSLSRGQDALHKIESLRKDSKSIVELVEIDVTVDESINKAVEHVKSSTGGLDILVNNAGKAFDRDFSTDTTDFRSLFNKTLDLNVTGSQVTTAAFAPLLINSKSPRLIFLGSGVGSLTNNSQSPIPRVASIPTGWPKEGIVANHAYKTSKTAVHMVMLSWHWLLKGDGVKTFAINPGFLATNLTDDAERMKKMGAADPALGGDLVRRVIEGERDEDVGCLVGQNGTTVPW